MDLVHVKLPEGAIVNAHLCVVQFIHPETGEVCWGAHHWGEVPTSQLVGLAELAKDAVKKAAQE